MGLGFACIYSYSGDHDIGFLYCIICFSVGLALWVAYGISARTKHRFSTTSLFYATTIASLYAAISSSWIESGFSISRELGFPIVCALALTAFINRIIGNTLFFIESWGNQRHDGIVLVNVSWYWPSHLFVAFVVFVLWAIGQGTDQFLPSTWCCFCITIAFSLHSNAVSRTSITTYRDGIEIVDKFWRWEDGKLELFEDEGIYRLGPSRIVNERKWGKWLWPEVPAKYLDAVRQVLNRLDEQDR